MTSTPQEPSPDNSDGPILGDRAEAEAIKAQAADTDADAAQD